MLRSLVGSEMCIRDRDEGNRAVDIDINDRIFLRHEALAQRHLLRGDPAQEEGGIVSIPPGERRHGPLWDPLLLPVLDLAPVMRDGNN